MPITRLFTRLQIATLAVLLLLISPAYAQRSSKGQVTVKFACASINQGLGQLAYLSNKEKGGFATLQLNVNYLTKALPVKFSNNGEVKLYDPSRLPTKENGAKPVVRFKVPSNSKNLIVLLVPAQNTANVVYHAKVIPAGDGFSYGSSCIVNLTNTDIYLKENKSGKPRKISTGANCVLGEGKSQTKVELGMARGESKKVNRFYSATWSLSSDVREICLIYQKPGKKWPSTKVISESRPLSMN